jgi:pimeloyl-ACP methyl ester carboxylesterase
MAVAAPVVNPAFLAGAEQARAAAETQEQAGQPACVDAYFQCAVYALQAMQPELAAPRQSLQFARAWSLYHLSLAKVLEVGPRFGRLDPRRGLHVQMATGPIMIPLTHHGFAWIPDDFQQILVIGEYYTTAPKRIYRRPGLGVPLIVIRHQSSPRDFVPPRQPFSATAVLRLPPTAGGSATSGLYPVIELYNPLEIEAISLGGTGVGLAADLSAPFAYAWSTTTRNPIRDVLQPGTYRDKSRLTFLKPYQPGKIPVVFVHGLLSDPFTWVDLANELQMRKEIANRFQFWAFQYPTGEAFLFPAADLRDQLRHAQAAVDPTGSDPALQHMVLVGHSMGGLISKLQVAHSGSILWNNFANRPLQQIRTDEEVRARLARGFFFEPLPFIRSVVFIGTPHRGSSLASQLIGRLGSSWIAPPTDDEIRYRNMVAQNPGVFAESLQDRLPTSIDMLEPENPLLLGIEQLPISPHVPLHSFIGYGHTVPFVGDGDGVVPVSSARFPGVETEQFINARHTELHHKTETVNGLLQILAVHAARYDAAIYRKKATQ